MNKLLENDTNQSAKVERYHHVNSNNGNCSNSQNFTHQYLNSNENLFAEFSFVPKHPLIASIIIIIILGLLILSIVFSNLMVILTVLLNSKMQVCSHL